MISVTDAAAWWGAGLATLVLAWDVMKWAKRGANVVVTIQPDMHYPDSEVLSERTDEHGGTVTELAGYHHIEFSNVGDAPTTIISIEATHKPSKRISGTLHMGSQTFTFHNGMNLPHKLGTGESASARLDMRRAEQLSERGAPQLLIRVSHKKKPLKIAIPGSRHVA